MLVLGDGVGLALGNGEKGRWRRKVLYVSSAWLSPSLASGGAWTLLSAPGIGAAGLRPLFAGGALKAILENSGGGGSGGS